MKFQTDCPSCGTELIIQATTEMSAMETCSDCGLRMEENLLDAGKCYPCRVKEDKAPVIEEIPLSDDITYITIGVPKGKKLIVTLE